MRFVKSQLERILTSLIERFPLGTSQKAWTGTITRVAARINEISAEEKHNIPIDRSLVDGWMYYALPNKRALAKAIVARDDLRTAREARERRHHELNG